MPSETPAAFRSIWPQFFTAYYFADKVSLISSVYTHRYDSVDHGRLGAMPLVDIMIFTFFISWMTSQKSGVFSSELNQAVGVIHPVVSRSLIGLEASGLVEPAAKAADGRLCYVRRKMPPLQRAAAAGLVAPAPARRKSAR